MNQFEPSVTTAFVPTWTESNHEVNELNCVI